MFYSPLRYPGGKNKLAKFISQICELNNINGHYVEPYAGGASVALHLLINSYVSKITINDKDKSIYAFWYCVLHKTEKLCDLIVKTDITVDNWRIQKDIQKRKNNVTLLDLGFSTFFLNRTNVSGIIKGGIIGGYEQTGNYKIDCRFNKAKLIKRIKRIAEYRKQISISCEDALDHINTINAKPADSSTIYYFDPPYYFKSESLYMNHYKPDDHKELSKAIRKIKGAKWIVSYDDTEEIKKMYRWCQTKKISLRYAANIRKIGNEVLFYKKLVVPEKI